MRWVGLVAMVLVVACAAGAGWAQDVVVFNGSLGERLTALDPAEPEGYLLLAEEVASERTTADTLQLARRLYVLAFELDRAAAFSHGVGASACIGLAELAPSEQDRRWLVAMAAAVDPRYAGLEADRDRERATSARTEFRAAQVLGLVRSGRGVDARRELEDARVRGVLERYETVMSPTGAPGELRDIELEARGRPDEACHGERVTLRPADEREQGTHQLCPVCKGDPGPRMSDARLLAQLRLEWTLLNARAVSWAAQLAVDGGAPLREADPEGLAASFGVDPGACVYRDGAWREP